MSYVPHMGYARPHTPGVRRRREDEIHTWRGARYTCLKTTNTATGCVTVQVGWEQTLCAGTCLYVDGLWFARYPRLPNGDGPKKRAAPRACCWPALCLRRSCLTALVRGGRR